MQTDVGLALGGSAGARLLAKQGLPTSRNTLLRRIRDLPLPSTPPPTAIGLDDWAQRRGQTYGTLIVDLDRHRIVDLLPVRSAEAVATWLRAQPQVRVVSRDRSEEYAAGVRGGAPTAIQVADRFHLLANVREAAEIELKGHPGLAWSPQEVQPAEASSDRRAGPEPIYAPTPSGQRADALRLARRASRLAAYEEALRLRSDGLPLPAIARCVGVSPRTLQRWWAAGTFPERHRRTDTASRLDPHTAYLLERWHRGCHNATHLWRELQTRGFSGSYGLVAGFLAPLRRGQPVRSLAEAGPTTADTSAPPTLTARQLAFLLIGRPEQRTAAEQAVLCQVQERDPVVAALATLIEAFVQMMRERTATTLNAWLDAAVTSELPELRRVARGLAQDAAAVQAALELPYSNGQTEGQITRLKLLKRQMYGRAKLDLLRLRLLHAA
jgi:transposase